jgi:hypothetical protein
LRARWTQQRWRSEAGQHCSIALVRPGGAVADDEHRRAEAAGDQVAAERLPVLVRLAHAEHHREQHALAFFGESPGEQDAFLGAVGADGEEGGVAEQRHQAEVVEVAAPNRSNRSLSSVQIRWAVDLATFPSPAFSHSDSTSRIDSPRTNAPITIALSGSVATSFLARGNSNETNGSAASKSTATVKQSSGGWM